MTAQCTRRLLLLIGRTILKSASNRPFGALLLEDSAVRIYRSIWGYGVPTIMGTPAHRSGGAGPMRAQFVRKGQRAHARLALLSGTALVSIVLVFAVAQGAAAQSVDIPLNYALNTGHNFGGPITSPVLI